MPTKNIKTLNEMTGADLIKIMSDAQKSAHFFHSSIESIVKHFLSDFLDIDPLTASFDEIYQAVSEQLSDKNLPENKVEFYAHIAKEYLLLVKEPREVLLNLYIGASKDLSSIQNNLEYLQSEKKDIQDEKDSLSKEGKSLSGEKRYRLKMVDFYHEKNMLAKEEIIQFLASDSIKARATYKSKIVPDPTNIFSKVFSNLFNIIPPYNFAFGYPPGNFPVNSSFGKKSYDIRNFSDVQNKLTELYIDEYEETCDLYLRDKVEFFNFLRNYIEKNNPVPKITQLVEKSHVLNRRKNIILTLLKHYTNKDYVSFIYMVPLQIEGIFHDHCLELGIKESQIGTEGITEKVKLINDRDHEFYNFEYYAFRFPVIRNDIAHGKLLENSNEEETAMMLLLDLLDVCQLTFSESSPINKAVNLSKNISDNLSIELKCDDLFKWIEFIDLKIPEFYQLDDIRHSILQKYEKNEFWEYLENKYQNNQKYYNESTNSDIVEAIKKLKSNSIAKKQCTQFLKNSKK